MPKIKGQNGTDTMETSLAVGDDLEGAYELSEVKPSPEKPSPGKLIESLTNPGETMFCSVVSDTRKGKTRLYNAVNNPSDKLIEHINEELVITDVIAYPVELVDENTGELFTSLRVVLIDINNKSYACVSQGIVNSLKRIFSIIGMPPWDGDDALTVIPKQQHTRNKDRKVLVLEVKE